MYTHIYLYKSKKIMKSRFQSTVSKKHLGQSQTLIEQKFSRAHLPSNMEISIKTEIN